MQSSTNIINISFTKNNVFLTRASLNGNVELWQTCTRNTDFKNSSKSTLVARESACNKFFSSGVFKKKNLSWILVFSGLKKWRRMVIKIISNKGIKITHLKWGTRIPFNGCKKKKVRRK